MKIFIAWFFLYFVPIFIMVHDGEKSSLEMARSMGEDISTLEWYFNISMISLMWAVILFLATFILLLLFRVK